MDLLKNWKFLILAALVIFSGVGYFVLYSQKTVQGNVNINKIDSIDKIYSYSVYSDFYFRAMKYDDVGKAVIASYSKLIPLKTSIGYDFANDPKHPEVALQTISTEGTLNLDDTNGREIERYIKTFNDYAKIFGSIVATQDQMYFNKSAQKIELILKSLYSDDVKFAVKDIEKYYTSVDAPILNMKIKYYKLDDINKNLKSFKYIQDGKEWQPNIAEWKFNENDRIFLRYLEEVHNNDLYDYLETDKEKKDALVIKTVKINDGKLDKIYLKIMARENKVECLFQDTNGYRYTLIMKTQAKEALQKYLPDFLKIAYGINFIDVKNFDNWFAKEQERKESYFEDIDKKITEIQSLNDQLTSLGVESSSLKYYRRITGYKFDEQFDKFKEEYGTYPNEDMLNKFNKLSTELSKKYKDIEELKTKASRSLSTLGFFGEGELKERCPNYSIKCMQKIIDDDADKVMKDKAIKKLNEYGYGGEGRLKKRCPDFSKSCIQKIIESDGEEDMIEQKSEGQKVDKNSTGLKDKTDTTKI